MPERKIILIVEDQKDWVDALKAYLSTLVRVRHLECDIEIATNSEDALAKLARYEQDEARLLLVCDNHLQESSGELFMVKVIDQQWREQATEWRKRTPIVIFSVTRPTREAKRLHANMVDKYPEVGDMGFEELEEAILEGLRKL